LTIPAYPRPAQHRTGETVAASPVSAYLPATQPAPANWSAPTRHLSAGAYLDAEFRRACLREVYYQPRRMVAPSYGFDLGTVLLHCMRARNISIFRDLALVLVLLFAVALSPLAFLVAMAVLWSAYLGVESWRVLRAMTRRVVAGEPVGARGAVGQLGLLVVRFFVSQLVFFVVAYFVAGGLTGLGGDPYAEPDATGTSDVRMAGVLFLLLAVYGIAVAANLVAQAQLSTLTPGGGYATAPTSDRFGEIAYQQAGNQVVYSGQWPFLGSGDLWDRWSFAQRLVRPAGSLREPAREAEREFATPPFSAQQLLDAIRTALLATSGHTEPENHLPGLTVQDRVFVAGTEISHLTPYTSVERVAQVIRQPTGPERHYLVCQIVSWRGEVVTTVYVHVAVQGRLLYLELISAGLPPCDERFRIVDQVGGVGPMAYARTLRDAVAETPRIAAGSLANLVRAGIDVIVGTVNNASAPADRAVSRGYDYGARTSVRDLGRALTPRSHLQVQDIDKYSRIIERRIMATVLDCLEAWGVDTTEFAERAVNILNAGAIHTGNGDINIAGPGVGNQTNHHGPAPAGGRA
jgi:hypothetical protein